MDEIRYIHAADLHLDTPFRGLGKEAAAGGHLERYLHQAPFTALEKLVRLCETEKPDFLLLAGDIYNQEERSIKAQLALRDACRRLNNAGIKVFVAHGNHDPLSSQLVSIEWPPNTTVFGSQPEQHICEKQGVPFAVVHGISHTGDSETRNLAQQFHRDDGHDCFQIGVLHCSPENASASDRCAVCTIGDLKDTGLDAWALGHIHERAILSNQPFIAYSGNTQGLHINEVGARGCLLVSAKKTDAGWSCNAVFRALGPVEWDKVEIDLEGADTLDELERRITNEIEKLRNTAGAHVEGMILRLHFTGRTIMDTKLRSQGAIEDLLEMLRHYADSHPAVWIKDIEIETHSLSQEENYLQRDDLLGESARVAQKLLEDDISLREEVNSALSPLTGNARFRKAVAPFDDARMRELVVEAERICHNVLEDR